MTRKVGATISRPPRWLSSSLRDGWKMHRLKSENVKATMTSGNIEASGISSDKLTLKMTRGNAEINRDFEDINCG